MTEVLKLASMYGISSVALIVGGIYLAIGFGYSIYVLINGGGGIFSIPINTLLGPISIPINLYKARKILNRKPPSQEIPPELLQEESEEELVSTES